MKKFTREQDVFIAAYFAAVGPEILAANDLPFSAKQIKARYDHLLKNRPDVFEQVKNEEHALEIILHYNLSNSSVRTLIAIYDGHTSLGRGSGMSVKALKARGFVAQNNSAYELSRSGAYAASVLKRGVRLPA